MVRVAIEAEIVVRFGLIEIGLAMFQPADAVIRRREIVVSVGIVRIGIDRFLKLLGGFSSYRACWKSRTPSEFRPCALKPPQPAKPSRTMANATAWMPGSLLRNQRPVE